MTSAGRPQSVMHRHWRHIAGLPGLDWNVPYLERQGLQVDQDVTGFRTDTADSAWIEEICKAAAHVFDRMDAGLVIMAATDQIVIPGQSKRGSIMRVMHQKNAASTQMQSGILTVVTHHAIRFVRKLGHRIEIACVIAMNDMHRQFELLQNTQCRRRYHVTAMQHGFRAAHLGVLYGMFEQTPVVMTIGEQADFHGLKLCKKIGAWVRQTHAPERIDENQNIGFSGAAL